jgi:uncharacterized protein (TIGR03083 family)
VGDVVAHVAHLEAIVAGAPEETVEVPEAPHLRNEIGYYTEAGVLARRGRSLTELVEEIERSVATRYAELEADPPADPDAPAPRTPAGAAWSTSLLLRNRPFDVWVHEQDVRRAVGRPGNTDSPAAVHALGMLGRGLPMVLAKRVGAEPGTSCRIHLPESDVAWTVQVGDDGRASFTEVDEPTCCLTLSSEDYLVLATGRREPADTDPTIDGDQELAARVLASLNVTF